LDLVAESLIHELCELLDEIFARKEAFGEDEGDDAGTLLSLAEIRSIGEEVDEDDDVCVISFLCCPSKF
jgi:hypothetical protein